MAKTFLFIIEIAVLAALGFICSELYLLKTAREQTTAQGVLTVGVSVQSVGGDGGVRTKWVEVGGGDTEETFDHLLPQPVATPTETPAEEAAPQPVTEETETPEENA